MENKVIAHKFIGKNRKLYIQNLEVHLFNVASHCKSIGETINLPWTCFLLGLTHDIGKATKNFQNYIQNETKEKINHSSAGGVLLLELFKDSDILIKEILSYVVFSHHGLFDLIKPTEKDMGFFRRINYNKENKYDENEIKVFFNSEIKSNLKEKIEYELEDIVELSNKELTAIILKIAKFSGNIAKDFYYYIHLTVRLLLSILKEGDIYDSANAFRSIKEGILTEDDYNGIWSKGVENIEAIYSKFKTNKKSSDINIARTSLANQAKDNSDKLVNGIFKAELPTGSGKTLLSTRFALNNCKYFNKKRFFYITAFLSVLEQNADEIKNIINDELVLEHHSNILSSDEKILYEENGNNGEYYTEQYMTDSWESPVILTTMVQFMNTLFKGKSANIRRFCKLIDSVIVLDEVQSIPISTIHNFNLVNNFLSEIMGATIIHCTATQPELDSEYLNYQSKYSSFNNGYLAKLEEVQEKTFIRTKAYYIGGDGFTKEELVEHIEEESEKSNSILIICNTKKVVSSIYKKIKSLEYSGFTIYQLTTNQCAVHRLRKIKEIKEKLKNDEKIIVVSSQLIEAGVDVDFKTVYRSLSGVPSLIQSMGRCNREGNLEYGKFYIFDLLDENTKMIQDIHEQKEHTRNILYKYNNSEINLEDIKMDYYNTLYSNSFKLDYIIESGVSMIDILSSNSKKKNEFKQNNGEEYGYFLRQNFKTAANNFKMIEDDGYTVVVEFNESFGELYDENKRYLEEYEKYMEEYDFSNSKIIFKKLQPYTINIRDIDKYQIYIKKVYDIFVLMPNYYNEEIGLNAEELETLIY